MIVMQRKSNYLCHSDRRKFYMQEHAIHGLVKWSNRVKFIEYEKITVKMSWLFLAKNLESLCDTEICEFFGDLKTL